MKLSVIVPYCNEYPQVNFTVCGLRCELENSGIDYEILTVSNQGTDKGLERLRATQTPNIKALEYNDKLSHWNAKNHAVQASTGDVLFFIDSHCILSKNALVNMFNYYTSHYDELHGTLHMPILYMNEQNGRELEYKMVCNITDDRQGLDGNPKNSPHNMHYVFTRVRQRDVHRVSCMSMCGSMMSREIYDKLGGWPTELGIYGGGENFINFTLAVMGYNINVFSYPNAVHHYAEKRGYAQPIYSKIKTPDGWIAMGDVKVGDKVLTPNYTTSNTEESTITDVFPQGIRDIFRVTLEDGRSADCTEDHLWKISSGEVMSLKEIRGLFEIRIPVLYSNPIKIKSIEYAGVYECQCIRVEHPSHLYVTDNNIITHNSWNYNDWIRNRIIASYMCGGEEWSRIFAINAKGRRNVLEGMWQDVVSKCSEQRKHIEKSIVMSPQEWVEREFREKRYIGEYK